MSWKDVLHYGAGMGLLFAAALAPVLNTIPGVHVDVATASAAGLGILAAGLKSGITSK